jgi:hypothetical protein
MPTALTQKMFGLPRWAWLVILVTAVGIGLYLRHKKAEEEKAEEGQGETTGEQQQPPEGAVATTGYEAAGVQGGGQYYPSAEGYYPSAFPAERPETLPEETNPGTVPTSVAVNIGSPSLPSATDGETAPASSAGASGSPCDGARKPRAKSGGHYECVSGRWRFTPQATHPPAVVTGGGPPNKPNNKGPGHSGGGGGSPAPAPAENNQGGAPQNNAQHPAAVNTGNPCVKGGVGGHTAPSGYHLFCQGGYIWRAPNN